MVRAKYPTEGAVVFGTSAPPSLTTSARQVSWSVRESLGEAFGESLEELLPVSNLLRPSQVLAARERGEIAFPGLMLVDTACYVHYNIVC
jgi:hypothetical protein